MADDPSPTARTGPRVLIVRPTALGDVARTVPALVTLRRAMPGAKIDWLVHEGFADIVRHHPALDGLVPFPRGRFGRVLHDRAAAAEFRAWVRGLRDQRYDLAVDLQGLFRSGLFARLSRAPKRVGYANAREMAWLFYNRRHAVDPRLHSVDRMLGLLEAEGFEPVRDLRLYVGDGDRRWLDGYLAERGIDGPYFCVAPTAKWRTKCWPLEHFTATARRLLDSGAAGRHAVVLAGAAERPYVAPMLQELAGRRGPHREAPDLVHFPETTVGQMAAILSRCSLLVCNDSAPLHVAVGFDRPAVAVFGPTDPALVGPYRRNDCVVQPPGLTRRDLAGYRAHGNDQSLIARVGVEAVWERIQRVLAGPTASG